MLFNSYAFIFAFLPVCLIGYVLLGRAGGQWPVLWLGAMSLVFYSVSGPALVWLLAGSIILNFSAGYFIVKARKPGALISAKSITALAIAADLAALGYYKYAGFFLANVTQAFGLSPSTWSVVLPVGISFYTFTQIAFLVDCYVGKVKKTGLPEYVLFVSYFPHLIAGPILHHAEMIPQFNRPNAATFSYRNFSTGTAIFIIGLAKKILLADALAPYADMVFNSTSSLSFADAWFGALAYTLQLYFDFSGYCDMAIGISLMFNIELPLNFYSPYRAASIVDFWRRWHMTLSRFLRDYLYIPLGGNRSGHSRRYVNLMITMMLGGLWHGAEWTFVVWGTIHGCYLLINHAFRKNAPRWLAALFGVQAVGVILTFFCVVVAWVFFRAPTIEAALHILRSMAGFGIAWNITAPQLVNERYFAFALLILSLVIVFACPNVQQIFRLPFHPVVSGSDAKQGGYPTLEPDSRQIERLRMFLGSASGAVLLGVLFGVSVLLFFRTTRFLYFQF